MTKPNQPNINDFTEGCTLLFDKPYGWTSFDIVGKVRGLLRRQLGLKRIKIGHAGTLDPLATGLLILCTGKMTKSIESFQNMEKEYTGTFFVGQTTPSFDLETRPDRQYPINHINNDMIDKAARQLTGDLRQIPPLFSAKKIEGERAYEVARRGEKAELKPRLVSIYSFEIIRVALPEVDFRIACSKGTYIRALARDFGLKLHSGAYLQTLRRTKIGKHSVDLAWNTEDFESYIRSLA